MNIISLEELKEARKKYLDASIDAYKKNPNDFPKFWDKFIMLNKSCIIFTDFPKIYELYLSHINDPTNIEKQNIYVTYFNYALESLKIL